MPVHTRDANANAEESVKKTIGGRHRHGRKKKEKFPFYSCVSVCVCVYVVKRTSVCTRIYYISFLFPNNQCVRYSVKILQFFFYCRISYIFKNSSINNNNNNNNNNTLKFILRKIHKNDLLRITLRNHYYYAIKLETIFNKTFL